MSASDKIENATADAAGKAKEAMGKLTGNEKLEAEGRAEQAEAALKKAGEHVQDAANDAKQAAKDVLDR